MCISCGCGHPADNHGDKRNITLQDIDAAAEAAGTTREKVLQNISDVAQPSQQNVTSHRQRQDGYQETQGEGYGNSENHYGEPANSNPAQQGYDPAHSGVRHAKNQPGKSVETPGRETGTSWGEDQQMGYTTDTPDRRNPAG
jgi:Mg-chelatase subunit ChlI